MTSAFKLLALGVCVPCLALDLTSPSDYQVFQRETRIRGKITITGSAAICDSVQVRLSGKRWQSVALSGLGCTFKADIVAAAGGWYKVEVRTLSKGNQNGMALVDHVGIGEIFVIAGQSNSTNYGEEKQQTTSGMVSSFNGGTWVLANDPQSGVQDSSAGGSFIPSFGDALYAKIKVPVGAASVGFGGSSVRQWLPAGDQFATPPTTNRFVVPSGNGQWKSDGTLFNGLLVRLRQLGPHGFRALLWHQGESDTHQDPPFEMPAAEYRILMERVIVQSRLGAGWNFPWFVAQVSYKSPADLGSPEIRGAQRSLWKNGLALQGPDSDLLLGEMRQNGGKGIHMSAKGLVAHGRMWAERVWLYLDKIAN